MHDTWIRSSSRGDRLAEQTRPDNAKAAPRAWNEPRDVATSVCVMNVVICVDAPAAAVCDGLALACSCSCSKRERMRSLLKSRNRPFRKSTGTEPRYAITDKTRFATANPRRQRDRAAPVPVLRARPQRQPDS